MTTRNPRITYCAFPLASVLLATGGCGNKIRAQDGVITYPGEGGVVITNAGRVAAPSSTTKTEPRRLCVAPPAQAAVELQLAATRKQQAKFSETASYSSETAFEYGETIARLHEKGERTLFLQFALYRLCEADLNRALYSASAFPTDCDVEKTMSDASVAFATTIESSAASARDQVEADRKAALAAEGSSRSAKSQLDKTKKALAKLKKEKAPAAKVEAAKSDIAIADANLAAATKARDAASKQLGSATTLAAAYADGLKAAIRIVAEDRHAHQRCRASLGTGAFERKYSEVLDSAVELWSFEAKAADARAAGDKAKAQAEGSKAKVKEIEAKSNEAAAKLRLLEATAIETLVSSPKKASGTDK